MLQVERNWAVGGDEEFADVEVGLLWPLAAGYGVILDPNAAKQLHETYMALNPVQLRRDLLKVKAELGGLNAMVSLLNEASNELR